MDGARFSINAAGGTDVDVPHFVPDPKAVACLDSDIARQCLALPISYDRQRLRLLVATTLVQDVLITERLVQAVATPIHITVVPLRCSSFDQAISLCYSQALGFASIIKELGTHREHPNTPDQTHPMVRLVNSVLHAAVDNRASDIHINPAANARTVIRFRVDGVLAAWQELPQQHRESVAVRIKLLASLDIAESRLPQDGQFSMQVQGRWVDFRVSTFPTTHGENLVLRVLDKRTRLQNVSELLSDSAQQVQLKTQLAKTDGLTIVCGPTGCGKSTTLLAMVAELDADSLNIMTLEDPVENSVNGIQQCSIKAAQQFDYADGVRALLRQDPDVLLIGEIRDSDSAAMAFRAALTGHRVLTTIHCRDTQSALARLTDLGISYSGIASCVNMLVAQRLVRSLCSECLQTTDEPITQCAGCNGTRYHGRFAVLEIMPITDSLCGLLTNHATPAEIWQRAEHDGLISLRRQIESLVHQGVTDQAESQRVLGVV